MRAATWGCLAVIAAVVLAVWVMALSLTLAIGYGG